MRYTPEAHWTRIGQYRSSLLMENKIEILLSPPGLIEIINISRAGIHILKIYEKENSFNTEGGSGVYRGEGFLCPPPLELCPAVAGRL